MSDFFRTLSDIDLEVKPKFDPEWWHQGAASRPINKLSEDALISVFEFARNGSKKETVEVLSILCCVCRQWKDLIYDTPSLWSVIKIGDERSRIALERSQDAELTIKIPYGVNKQTLGDTQYVTPSDIGDLLDSLLPHSDRISQLSLIWPVNFSAAELEPVLIPLPRHLRTLEIGILPIFPEKLENVEAPPTLRNLGIVAVPIPWSRGFLRGLHTLELLDVNPWPTWQDMLACLRECPDIQEIRLTLSFKKDKSEPIMEPRSSTLERIRLSSLWYFNLSGVEDMRYLPQFIDAPHITHCDVDVPLQPLPGTSKSAENFTRLLFPPGASSVVVSALRNLRRKQVEVDWIADVERRQRFIWIGDKGTGKNDAISGIAVPDTLFGAVYTSVITSLGELGFKIRLVLHGTPESLKDIAMITSPAVECVEVRIEESTASIADQLAELVRYNDASTSLLYPNLSSVLIIRDNDPNLPIPDVILDDSTLQNQLTSLCYLRQKDRGIEQFSVKTSHHVFNIELGKFVPIA